MKLNYIFFLKKDMVLQAKCHKKKTKQQKKQYTDEKKVDRHYFILCEEIHLCELEDIIWLKQKISKKLLKSDVSTNATWFHYRVFMHSNSNAFLQVSSVKLIRLVAISVL